ncbi:MAG: hypothetical protein C0467_29515, partial [Planctomycetaceae bacterium]|nr:hypothetical protein [Planctomycetaceae bacterium]
GRVGSGVAVSTSARQIEVSDFDAAHDDCGIREVAPLPESLSMNGSLAPTIPPLQTAKPTTPERSSLMKSPETNGHTPPRGDPPDPLEIAEELRAMLTDAATKATKLVAALRHTKKEKKALSSVLANLKQLNLGGGVP